MFQIQDRGNGGPSAAATCSPSASYRAAVILLLLGAGIYWFFLFGPKSLGKGQIIGLVAAAIAAFLPSVNRGLDWVITVCNEGLKSHRARTSLIIGIATCAYLFCFAWASQDRLFLKLNDEHAYMIQARLISRGRLWMPAYPPEVAPFFDALAMIVDRVYAPMYFPGTALAMAPFCLLGLPFWSMTILAAAVAAAFFYAVVADLFDPFRGLLAVVLLASLQAYRDNAILLLSESPFLAAEMILLWGWLEFYKRPALRWAIVIGAAGGYAAITRPLDAICFVLPIGIAILRQLRKDPRALISREATMIAAATPFLLLLIAQNAGVTGHWWELAEGYWNRQNFPASPMGFHAVELNQIPADAGPLKQQWLHDWVVPSFQRHTLNNAIRTWYRGRCVMLLDNALPNPILLLMLPVGLLSARGMRRAVILMPLALFCVGYAVYLFFLEHYVVSVLPAMICLLLMGEETLQTAFSGKRIRTFITLALLAISISVLWPVVPPPELPVPFAPDQKVADNLLAKLPITPAVVLFRFDPAVGSFHDDPVYNDSAAFPDEAAVVRARDLGAEKDRDIVHYYAVHQPNRVFYIYDSDRRASGLDPLSRPLGTARDLDTGGSTLESH